MGDIKQPLKKDLLRCGIEQLSLDVNEQGIDLLAKYMEELQKWNRRINLIARNTPAADIVEKHFLDSLTLLPFLQKQKLLLDVGTGAGFPGLVLAVVLPELQVVLVEPRSKRVSFLRHIIRTLSLTNVEVLPKRLEDISATGWATPIDYITSRAVADPTVFIPMVTSYLDQGTKVLLMLGPGSGKPWEEKSFEPELRLQQKKRYILPVSKAERIVCLVHKKNI